MQINIVEILGRLDHCQFYHLYQGVGTQHGGRAPLMRKLIIKTNTNNFCLRRSWMGVAAQACYFTTTQCATLPFRALRSVGERYALRDRFASCNADATLSDLICVRKLT